MIPLDRVDAFIAFAEKKSFTHAAKQLHLSQPALFAQIQKLEEQLGVSVYRRKGRSLEITDEGERVLGFARELRQRVLGFEASLRGERVDDPVVLSAGRGSYLYLLGPAMRRFRRSRWSLTASVAGRDRCLEEVRLGRAHVGVAAAVTDVPDDLVAHPFVEVGSVVAFPKGHRFEGRKKL
ncbi:MAG: LysR family transcriptional regulator, partial [Polyangiaceae bacterium]